MQLAYLSLTVFLGQLLGKSCPSISTCLFFSLLPALSGSCQELLLNNRKNLGSVTSHLWVLHQFSPDALPIGNKIRREWRDISCLCSCFSLPFNPSLCASLFLSTCCHQRRSQPALLSHNSPCPMQGSRSCPSCPTDFAVLNSLTLTGCPILPQTALPICIPRHQCLPSGQGLGSVHHLGLYQFLLCFLEPFPAELLTFPFLQAPWGRSLSPSKKDKSQ